MDESAFVVVFPSVFAKSKQGQLIQNIRKILKIQGQKFGKISRDGELVIVDANDPVFASSAINLLFGVSRIVIARRVENKYDTVVSSIARIGANLLLSGEQFYVKVEGHSTGYIPKDVELAATSALIEKSGKSGCRPGTEERHDKQIYCYLTQKNAYIAIFSDEGHGGVPYNSQGQQMICCMYDELSAIACLEAIKQGFDVRLAVCYNDSNVHDMAKMVNRIIPRTLSQNVTLDFFNVTPGQNAKGVLRGALVATRIMCELAKEYKIQRVGLALSPLAYPAWFIDANTEIVRRGRLSPWLLLSGIDGDLIRAAKEMGLGKHLRRIERFGTMKFTKDGADVAQLLQRAKKSRIQVALRVGPNNIHEMLDQIKH